LDAVTALTHRGSCTSNANLVAALFRASGVPARVLAVYPTNGQPLQTHYIVEYFVPGYGWVWAESSIARTPWEPYKEVVVNVVYPEDEDRSFAQGGAGRPLPEPDRTSERRFRSPAGQIEQRRSGVPFRSRR